MKRRAELRPHVHGVGQRQHPVGQPRAADVNERKHAGADHGKDGHGLGEAADGVAPALLEQQQDGRDQRAGVADADPPDEVDDGKAPGNRLGDGPDAGALEEQPGKGDHQHGGPAAGQREKGKPAQRRVRRKHNARDLLGDRPEGLARPDDAVLSGRGIDSGVAVLGRHVGFTSLVALGRSLIPSPADAPPASLRVPGSG